MEAPSGKADENALGQKGSEDRRCHWQGCRQKGSGSLSGNRELVFDANNPERLVHLIKWASTVASTVSQPTTRPEESRDEGADVQDAPLPLPIPLPDSEVDSLSDMDIPDVW